MRNWSLLIVFAVLAFSVIDSFANAEEGQQPQWHSETRHLDNFDAAIQLFRDLPLDEFRKESAAQAELGVEAAGDSVVSAREGVSVRLGYDPLQAQYLRSMEH